MVDLMKVARPPAAMLVSRQDISRVSSRLGATYRYRPLSTMQFCFFVVVVVVRGGVDIILPCGGREECTNEPSAVVVYACYDTKVG